MVRRRELQERDELPALLPRQRFWRCRALHVVLVQVDQHKVVVGQLDAVVPSIDADDVGTGRFYGGEKPSGQDRDQDAGPRKRVEQAADGPRREVEHGRVGRQQDYAGLG